MSDYIQNQIALHGGHLGARKNIKQPSREEIVGRNSFPSVNDNKHLDRMFGKSGGK